MDCPSPIELFDNKNFYKQFHDQMIAKRYNSPYPVRRNVHRDIYDSILKHIDPEVTVLDSGCGEGMLTKLISSKGAKTIGMDLSKRNIESAKAHFPELDFQVGDLENLPFADGRFHTVVSNHVLEHLPNFDQGLKEVLRVAQRRALIAIPTNLSPLSWPLLGGDQYWIWTKKSIFALPWGLAKVFWAFLRGDVGVDEGYAGQAHACHIHRFPWILKRKLKKLGYNNVSIYAQSLRIPYFTLPHYLSKDFRGTPILKNLGLGTLYIIEKSIDKEN